MIDAWISLFVIAVMGASSWGTGAAILRWLRVETPTQPGFPMVVGVAGWCFLGGALNLLHAARPVALGLLLAVGVLLGGSELARRLRRGNAATSDARTGFLIVAGYGVLLLLLTVFQMPSAIMNVGDDFETYLGRPVRMLATWSLATDPFDGLGQDSLGAQSFLQAFLLLALPLPFLSGFDHVFCLMLCLLLIREIAMSLQLGRPWTIAASVLLLLVHPQSVNISSVYSTTALALGLVLALMRAGDRRSEILLSGLLLGALATLKTISAFHAAFFGLSLALSRFPRRRTDIPVRQLEASPARDGQECPSYGAWLRAHLGIAGVATAVVLPWVLAYRDRYAAMLGPTEEAARYVPPADVQANFDFFDFLGVQKLFYGGSLPAFDLVVLLLVVFVAGWFVSERGNGPRPLLPVAVTAFAALLTFLLNNLLFNAQTAIRYSVPLFLAAGPLALLGGGAWLRASARKWAWGVVGCAAAVGCAFLQPAWERGRQMMEWQTYLPFAVNESDAQVCSLTFSPGARNYLRVLQQHVPAGSSILTWMRTPFLLDHERNRVFTASSHGMMAPWIRPPLTADPGDMRRFLRARGVDFVLLEREEFSRANEVLLQSGNAVYHRVATYDTAIENGLQNLAKQARVVAAHDRFVVFEVPKE